MNEQNKEKPFKSLQSVVSVSENGIVLNEVRCKLQNMTFSDISWENAATKAMHFNNLLPHVVHQ